VTKKPKKLLGPSRVRFGGATKKIEKLRLRAAAGSYNNVDDAGGNDNLNNGE
jgi:hypothetical protein